MSEQAKVALVTGGARRVGRAIAERLAKAGYDVAITWHTSQREADDLITQLQSLGRQAIAIEADLTDPEPAVARVEGDIREHFGRLDVLVNNASLYHPATLAETDITLLRRLDALHVHAPLLLCQALQPMLTAAGGHVVNMVDLLAERPWPRFMAYCASKAGLWNLTLSLAREMAPAVTVNGIAPGVVEWPEDMPEAERERYLRRVPLGRAGTPDDVARLVHFLVTDGTYITGQVIRLDGGRSVHV